MRKTLLVCLAIVFLGTIAVVQLNSQKRAPTNTDDAAIRKDWQDYVAAWNKHDTKLLASYFTDDVDRRTNDGQISNGRSATLAAIEKSFGIVTKDGTFVPFQLVSLQVDIRFLSRDVAILDASDELRINTGMSFPTNHTSIFVRKNGRWLTTAIRAWPLTTPTAKPETR